MRLFDTHAHLDLPPFDSAEEQRSAGLRAQVAGIAAILIPGIKPSSWSRIASAANTLGAVVPNVRFHTSFGVHPHVLRDLLPENDKNLAERLQTALLGADSSLVAIGECGLDFGPRGSDIARVRQLAVLDIPLAASRKTGLPLLLHCVRAHGALLERLLAAPTPPAILHAFSGSTEVASRLCRAGHYISFAGSVTLPNAKRPRRSAAAVPAAQLLLETDSPDQTPFARRPASNEPAFLVDIAAAIAEIRGLSLEEIASQTTANACRALGITLW
ncbi:MAG TPA: TatD family deoxyribonuclease [Nannocystis exedens]|nr:TatD family deoxyribonuclease [Nannocystis exedens]